VSSGTGLVTLTLGGGGTNPPTAGSIGAYSFSPFKCLIYSQTQGFPPLSAQFGEGSPTLPPGWVGQNSLAVPPTGKCWVIPLVNLLYWYKWRGVSQFWANFVWFMSLHSRGSKSQKLWLYLNAACIHFALLVCYSGMYLQGNCVPLIQLRPHWGQRRSSW